MLDGDRVALIEIASGLLIPDAYAFPVRKANHSLKSDMEASRILGKAADWENLDATVLGILYESLLDHRDAARSKQTHRRRSGIFYTPPHITRFLVGAALDACRIDAPPSILDPACGCGAFLIAAFRELRRRYPDADPATIATHCLHGMDIDPSAVHVARLSLYIEAGLKQDHWSILESSIRVGDSLREGIGQDRLYPVMVGNPPYRNVKRGIPADLAEFCRSHYKTAKGQWDIAAPFVELALDHLLEPGGACGFILPNPILLAENYQPAREIILRNDLVAYGPAGRPFEDPNVEASLLVVRKGRPGKTAVILEGRNGNTVEKRAEIAIRLLNRLPFKVLSHLADSEFIESVLNGLDRGVLVRLGDLVTFTRGIECGKRDPRIVDPNSAPETASRALLTGETVEAFSAIAQHRFLLSSDTEKDKVLKDSSLWMGDSQLLVRRVAPRPIAAVASPPALALNTLYVARGEEIDNHAACALINSEIFRDLFVRMFAFDDSLFPYLRTSQLRQVPVPIKALTDPTLSDHSKRLHMLSAENPDALKGTDGLTVRESIDARVREFYRDAIGRDTG